MKMQHKKNIAIFASGAGTNPLSACHLVISCKTHADLAAMRLYLQGATPEPVHISGITILDYIIIWVAWGSIHLVHFLFGDSINRRQVNSYRYINF